MHIKTKSNSASDNFDKSNNICILDMIDKVMFYFDILCDKFEALTSFPDKSNNNDTCNDGKPVLPTEEGSYPNNSKGWEDNLTNISRHDNTIKLTKRKYVLMVITSIIILIRVHHLNKTIIPLIPQLQSIHRKL